MQILPVELGEQQTGQQNTDYIYEQPAEKLLDRLLPRYVETQVLRAMLESSAEKVEAPSACGTDLRNAPPR